MMRKYALLGINILLLSRLAVAQDVKSPVVLEPVSHSKAFPTALRFTIPKSGESRFWGESKLKYQGKPIWIHVYNVAKADFSVAIGEKDYAPFQNGKVTGNGVQKSILDLFIKNEKQQWQRLSSNSFSYLRYGIWDLSGETPKEAATEDTLVNTLWLDAKSKSKPVIEIDFVTSGYMSLDHEYIFVIFPDGLNQKPVIEQFYDGTSNAGSWGIRWVRTDNSGHLLTQTHEWSIGSYGSDQILVWDGKHFVPLRVMPPTYRKDRQPIKHITEHSLKTLKMYKSFMRAAKY